MLEKLKRDVCRANRALVEHGLVRLTFGNVSGIDPERTHVVIKPSGVPYSELQPEQMVVVDFNDAERLSVVADESGGSAGEIPRIAESERRKLRQSSRSCRSRPTEVRRKAPRSHPMANWWPTRGPGWPTTTGTST